MANQSLTGLRKQPEFDQKLRDLFLEDYQKAAAGYLDDWIRFT